MSEDDVGQLELFPTVEVGREGRQFESCFRALSAILEAWVRHPERGEGNPDGMGAIAFDKFVNFFCRCWDHLAAVGEGPEGSAESQGAPEKVVSFPTPLQELPGKHGRGRAVYDGKSPPMFSVKLLYELQEEDILHYFRVKVPEGVERSRAPGDPRTVVGPGYPITDWRRFLCNLTKTEQDIIDELRRGVRGLTEEEVRALGTHSSFEQTCQDIEREYSYLRKQKVAGRLLTELEEDSGDFYDVAELFVEYIDEAVRKAGINSRPYESGRRKLLGTVMDKRLVGVIRRIQPAAEEIWRDRVEDYAQEARLDLAYAKYFRAVAEARRVPSGRRSNERLVQSARACTAAGGISPPGELGLIFGSEKCSDAVKEFARVVLKEKGMEGELNYG